MGYLKVQKNCARFMQNLVKNKTNLSQFCINYTDLINATCVQKRASKPCSKHIGFIIPKIKKILMFLLFFMVFNIIVVSH